VIPSARRIAPNIALAGVAPAVAYWLIRPHVPSDAIALIIVTAFPLADVVIERHERRRMEPIGTLALVGICIGVLGTVLTHGDETILKVRGTIPTGAIGLICLGSLFAPRPLLFYVARTFETQGEPERTLAYNERGGLPHVQHHFRVVTAVWGLGLIAESVTGIVLALTVPTQMFLILAQVASWTWFAALVCFTVVYARRASDPLGALRRSITGHSDEEIEHLVDTMGGTESVLDMRFDVLRRAFIPKEARDGTLRYAVTRGNQRFDYTVVIDQGHVRIEKRPTTESDVVVSLSLPDTLRLAVGERSAGELLRTGNLSVEGDWQKAIDFPKMFAS
jgi:hypothetical protein